MRLPGFFQTTNAAGSRCWPLPGRRDSATRACCAGYPGKAKAGTRRVPRRSELIPDLFRCRWPARGVSGEYVLSWPAGRSLEDPAAIRPGGFAALAERAGGAEMIGLWPTTAIFLATAPTDSRKAYDGLAVLVRQMRIPTAFWTAIRF